MSQDKEILADIEMNPIFPPIDDEAIITLCKQERRKWNTRTEARAYFHHMYMTKPMGERECYGDVLMQMLLGKKFCADKN